MTVQLSSLRVSADLDGNKYVAGAKSMSAANDQLVASGMAAGGVVTSTQTKVAAAGDVWTRLSRQYVEGASQAQKMQGALRTLQRGLDTGNVSMEQAEQIIDGLNRKLGTMANAEELAANGQMQLATAVTNVNARMKDSVPVHTAVGRVGGQNAFVMQNLAFQLNDVVSGFAMGQRPMQIFAQQGGQIYQALSMGEGGVGGSLRSIMGLLVRLAPILLPIVAVVGALSVGVAALGDKLSEGQPKALTFGQTLKGIFVTGWNAFTDGFGSAPAWMSDLWKRIGEATAVGINNIIQQFAILGVQVRLTFEQLPNILAGGLQDELNNEIIPILNAATDGVNGLARALARLAGQHVTDPTQAQIDATHVGTLHFADDAKGTLATANDAANKQVAEIMGTNYLPLVYSNGIAGGKKPKTGGTKRDSFADLIAGAKGATAALQAQAAALGQSTQQAAYLENKQKLLNQAERDHIKLSPQQVEAIDEQAQAYGRAKAQLESMTEIYNTLKDAFTGFFSDLKQNLQQGQTVWEAFGNAASNALNKIADKALDMATSGIFDLLWNGGASGSASSGGGLGSIISGAISSLFHFAGGTNSAPGGLAVVGERGPELVNLPRGAQVFSNQRSMSMLAANQNMPTVNFSPVYNINGSGLSVAQLQAVLAANNAALLKQVPTVVRDAYRRAA